MIIRKIERERETNSKWLPEKKNRSIRKEANDSTPPEGLVPDTDSTDKNDDGHKINIVQERVDT